MDRLLPNAVTGREWSKTSRTADVIQATSLVGTVLGLDHGAVSDAAVVAEDAAVVVGEDGDDAQHPHAHDGEAGRPPAEEHLPHAE